MSILGLYILLRKTKTFASYFSFFYLLIRFPLTVYRLLKGTVFVKEASDDEVVGWIYGYASASFWYYRVGKIFERYGLAGYVYENGLGSAMKDKFFQHYLSYGPLLTKLRYRRFMILSAGIFCLSLLIIGGLTNHLLLAGLVTIVVLGSPFFIFTFFHMAKPENLGWSLFPLTCFLFIKGFYIPASLFLLIMSLVSITATFFATAFLFPLALLGGINILAFIGAYTPTAIKIILGLIPFFRNVGIKSLSEVLGGRGKNKTYKNPNMFRLGRNAIFMGMLYLSFPLALLLEGAHSAHWLAMLSPLVLMLVNYKFFRFADHCTFPRSFLALSTLYALVSPNLLYLIFYGIVLWTHPKLVLSVGRIDSSWLKPDSRLKSFPYCIPITVGKKAVKQIKEFFGKIPDGSRISWEAEDSFSREMGGYRHFNILAEYLIWDRKLELLPGVSLRSTQTDYFIGRYAKLTEGNSISEVESVCKELGVQYLLCYSPSFVTMLIQNGYKVVSRLNYDVLPKSCLGEFFTPQKELFLLQCPFSVSLIESDAVLIRKPNEMYFEAKARQKYVLKYTYHRSWKAYQNGKQIPVHQGNVNGLSCLEIIPPEAGQVTLRFRPGLFG